MKLVKTDFRTFHSPVKINPQALVKFFGGLQIKLWITGSNKAQIVMYGLNSIAIWGCNTIDSKIAAAQTFFF